MILNRLTRTHTSVLWGFVDQAFSSATNLALSIIAARVGGPAGLGTVFVGFAVYLIALGFQRALMTDPLVTSSASEDPEAARQATRSALTLVLLVGSVATVVVLVLGAALAHPAARGLLLIAPWMIPALVQDLWRTALFRDGRSRQAAANDGAWLAGMALALPLLVLNTSDWTVMGIWGAGACLSAAVGFAQVRSLPLGRRAALLWYRRAAWPLGKWLGLESLVYMVGTGLITFLLAATLGSAAVGGLRAVQAVFAPLTLIAPAIALPGLPALARAAGRSFKEGVNLGWRIGFIGVIATSVYLMIMMLVGPRLLELVFGESFGAFGELVLPLGLGQVLGAAAIGFPLLLKAQNRGRELFLVRLWVTPVVLIILLLAAPRLGLVGAVWILTTMAATVAIAVAALANKRPPQVEGGPDLEVESPSDTLLALMDSRTKVD